MVEGFNPSCGDEVSVALILNGDGIRAVRFQGQGCSISQSSASMLTEEVQGRSLDDVRALSRDVQRIFTDDGFDPDATDVGDLEALQGVARFPVRIKCALLAWKVLDQALDALTGPDPDAPGADDSDIQTRLQPTSAPTSAPGAQDQSAGPKRADQRRSDQRRSDQQRTEHQRAERSRPHLTPPPQPPRTDRSPP